MNKMILKLLCISVIASGTIMLSACQKCYDCEDLADGFICIKATDSIYTSPGVYHIADTLNYYEKLGYVCDTLEFHWYNAGVFCGKNGYEYATEKGARCYVKH